MNSLQITIELENEAFALPHLEVARILRELATSIESNPYTWEAGYKLKDFNGNSCGICEMLS